MASSVYPTRFCDRYDVLDDIGLGSFAVVTSCRNKITGQQFACKQLTRRFFSWADVESLSEVKALLVIPDHPNLLRMVEGASPFYSPLVETTTPGKIDQSARCVSLVFDLMDMDLDKLIKTTNRLFRAQQVQSMIRQILKALNHLHTHKFIHRDIKPENILVKIVSKEYLLVLGDFGTIQSTKNAPPYGEYISTRWYRAPECLLTAGHYGIKIDIWAAGCILYEILTLVPLFPGISETDQIDKINDVIGAPSAQVLQKFFKQKSKIFSWQTSGTTPKLNELMKDTNFATREFLGRMLEYDPDLRASAADLLEHAYFKSANTLKKVVTETTAPVAEDESGPIPCFRMIKGSSGKIRILTRDQTENLKSLSTKIPTILGSSSDIGLTSTLTPKESSDKQPDPTNPEIQPIHLEAAAESGSATTLGISKPVIQASAPVRIPRKKRMTFKDHVPVSGQIALQALQGQKSPAASTPPTYKKFVGHFSQIESFGKLAFHRSLYSAAQENYNRIMSPPNSAFTLNPLKSALKINTHIPGSVRRVEKKKVTFRSPIARFRRIAPRPQQRNACPEPLPDVDMFKNIMLLHTSAKDSEETAGPITEVQMISSLKVKEPLAKTSDPPSTPRQTAPTVTNCSARTVTRGGLARKCNVTSKKL